MTSYTPRDYQQADEQVARQRQDREGARQIRIEALRAAAVVMAGVEADKRSGDIAINMAAQFAAYLESGE